MEPGAVQFVPMPDPTPQYQLDEMRKQTEHLAEAARLATEAADVARAERDDAQRHARLSLIAAWVGIGVAVVLGIASLIVTAVVAGG